MTLAFSAALAFGTNTASATTITFEADTVGVKPNGFVSADSPLVSFSDTLNMELVVLDLGAPTGHGLAVLFADPSLLRMDFAQSVNSLQLAFGNDQVPGTRAWLQVFQRLGLNLIPVGLVSVPVNNDGLINQTISFSGAEFTVATFWFGNDVGTPLNQIELVDNITFNVVPEPATMLLLGTGVATLVARRRRARR